jgi:penicillin-binding protein 2
LRNPALAGSLSEPLSGQPHFVLSAPSAKQGLSLQRIFFRKPHLNSPEITFCKNVIKMLSRNKSIKNSANLFLNLGQPFWKEALTTFFPKDRRAKILLGLLGVIIFMLVGRLFFLQVVKGTRYKQMAEENRIFPLPLPASRGMVKDRNGKIIATDRPTYTVSLIPYELTEAFPKRKTSVPINDITPLLEKLSFCLKSDISPLEEKITSHWCKSYQPIKLKKDVDFNTICVIEEQSDDLPGVIYQVEPTRKYVEAGWVGHALGYVNELTKEEISKDSSEKVFHLGGIIGRKGIEKQYDDLLRGKDGMVFQEVTARGKILGPLEERKPDRPVNGSDVWLTLDADLQAVAESALTDYQSAAVVALDPRNGEILALVSKPGLDANLFAGVMSPAEWKEILENPFHPLLTRPIQATYPPGSTLKLLTAAIALETGLANRNTTFSPCNGSFQFGKRAFGCWQPGGHGRLDLVDAIIQSCDVYFYQLGLRVGLDRWSRYAQLCGLGQKTGVDLPEEAKGFIPTREYYQKKYGKGEWINNLVINLAIGQGEILVTPLQLTVFFGGLATDGTLYKPHLLKEVIAPDGKLISTQPEKAGHLPFSSATLRTLHEAMIGVVNEPSGTGFLAHIPDITVAGKTGTAQNPHGEAHAWFVGYAPAEYPQIVVVVLIENVGHGGTFSAPVAKKIIERYFKKDYVQTVADSTTQVSSY